MTPQQLADDLIGTCRMCLPHEEFQTEADVTAFEELAFECDGCGWWASTEELHNTTSENLCSECTAEGNGDD